jgi:uncharacterized membrane protein
VRPAAGAASALPGLAFALFAGLLTALAASRLRSGAWFAAATAGTALVHTMWAGQWCDDPASPLAAAMLLQLAAVALFTLWPIGIRPAFDLEPVAWRAAALAAPAWLLSAKWLYEQELSRASIGVVPLVLGTVPLAAAAIVRSRWRSDSPIRATALTWYSAVALSAVSVAIPIQLERQWITIGWALNGAALIALWRRVDRPGLKYFGFGLLAAATVRLVANPAVLSYADRGSWPVLNWLLYTYLVPAAALLAGRALLDPVEVPRLRAWERRHQGDRPMLTLGCGVAAAAVVFVWINLAIADFFSTSSTLTLSFERMPARDLTTSIAWTLYGLSLLALGIRGRSLTLRWLSLLIFLATIAKVFLHDLGELRDLYRVASLAGLAISLIIVSVVYQRFVLRPPDPQRSADT